MKLENILKECLFLVPATTKKIAEELDVEPEKIEHVLKESEHFTIPFDKDGSNIGEGKESHINWELSERGTQELGRQTSDIENVKNTIITNFDEDVWKATEVCLSVISTLLLKDSSNPTGLNMIGSPSSKKTTVLSFFYGLGDIIFKTDNFTPKSFVTHASNIKENDLQKIDLLPKIKDKCLIIPELAPIFGKRKEDLLENMSILTRIFDGEGLETDSGVRGHRGYTGQYLFSWLGATTPFSYNIWRTMGKLGARWFFYNMRERESTEDELMSNITSKKKFKFKVRECRRVVNRFLQLLWANGVRSVTWNSETDDEETIRFIVKCGKLLAKLRGVVDVYQVETESGDTHYSYKTPLIEKPERAISILYNIARGHALVHNRTCLTPNDKSIIWDITSSSMPHDRSKLIYLFLKHDLPNTNDIKSALNCSGNTAKRLIETMKILGVVNTIETDDGNVSIELKKEFSWVSQCRDLSQDKS